MNLTKVKQSLVVLVIVLLPLLTASTLSALSVIKIELVSRSTSGDYANSDSHDASISADGRYVAFRSYASNLVSGDGNSYSYGDVFVYDRQTGTTERVSVSITGGDPDSSSLNPSINADGRYVAFESSASNLVSGAGFYTDIFVYDRQTSTTELVSVSVNGGDALGDSFNSSISADGRYVAFESSASNLVSDDNSGSLGFGSDVFVYDRQTGTTERVSVDVDGGDPDFASYNPSISANGRYVAFDSGASDLVIDDGDYWDVFVYDRQTGVTELVPIDINIDDQSYYYENSNPSISADGRYVAYRLDIESAYITRYFVFVYDRQTGLTEHVSVNINGGFPDDDSYDPSISADGRYVAFSSYASDLVIDDGPYSWDVFVYDRHTGTTERVSVNINGGTPNSYSIDPSISADGRYVAFLSTASDLVSDGGNIYSDVFVAELDLSDSPAITINTPTFQHQSLPELNSISLPEQINIDGQPAQPTTYDGNLVKIQSSVQNVSNETKSIELSIVETISGNTIWGPTTKTLAPGEIYNEFDDDEDAYDDWDTIGYAWKDDDTSGSLRGIKIVVKEGSNVIAESTPEPIWISPRPVFLVHGWNSSANSAWLDKNYPKHFSDIQADWKAFAVDTLSTGGDSGTFQLPIYNAAQLDAYIRAKRYELDAHHVDLVAHSYGGLISRFFVDDVMPYVLSPEADSKPVITNLVMLGTPNLGTECATPLFDIVDGASFFTPANIEVFNLQYSEKHEVFFYNLAGTAHFCLLNEGDGVVGTQSALYTGDSIGTYYRGHHFLCSLYRCLLDSTVFEDAVKPWLALSTSEHASRISEPASNTIEKPRTVNTSVMTDYRSLVVNAGTTEAVTIPVNGASSLVYSGLNPPGVTHTLFDPSNAVVETITEEYMFPMINVALPTNGNYTVQITNNGAQAVEIKYNVWQSDISVQMNLDVGESSLSGQVPINLTVTTVNSTDTISNVSADIMDNDNNIVATVPLTFDGTKYTGITPPLTTGLYGIFAHAKVNGVEFHQIDVAIVGDIYGDSDTSLVANGGFEGSKFKGVPVGWKGSNTLSFRKDKQKCNKPEKDKYVAYSGDCAFMFKGNPSGSLSKIKQTVSDTSLFTDGSNVEFSVYVDKRSANVGHAIGKLVIKYDNNTKDKLVLKVPSSDGYTQVSHSVLLDLTGRNISKVKVQFRNRLKTGKFFIDDASLTVIPPTSTAIKRSLDTVPLPDVPADFRD